MVLHSRYDRDELGFPVVVVQDHPGLTEALEDAVGARRPKGVGGPSVSTYGVDWARRIIEANRGGSEPVEVSSGPVTRLVVTGETVVAESLDDIFEADEVPRAEAVELLTEYRSEIVRVAGLDKPQPWQKPPHDVWVAGAEAVSAPQPTQGA